MARQLSYLCPRSTQNGLVEHYRACISAEWEWEHVGVVRVSVRGRNHPGFFSFGARYELIELYLFRYAIDLNIPPLWGRVTMKVVDLEVW